MRAVVFGLLTACSFRGGAGTDAAPTSDGSPLADADPFADAMPDARVDPFVPPAGVSGPILAWFAAEDVARDGAGNVTSWPDRGPRRLDLSPDSTRTAPRVVRGTATLPVVRFGDARLSATTGLVPNGTTIDELAIFAVMHDATTTDFDWVVYEGSSLADRISISHDYGTFGTWDFDVTGANRLKLADDSVGRQPAVFAQLGKATGPVYQTGAESALLVNGSVIQTLPAFAPYTGSGRVLEVGDHVGGDNPTSPYDGLLGELYVLQHIPTKNEIERIQTYFALRYGLTLAHSYRASDDTTVRSTTSYQSRIFGLARDAVGGLDVRAAKAALGGDLLVLRAPPPTATLAYAIAGDDADDLATTGTAAGTRVARTWKITATHWDTPITFDVAGLGSGAANALPFVPTDVVDLLIDDDAVLSNLSTRVPMTFANGRWTATFTLEDADGDNYFTFITSS